MSCNEVFDGDDGFVETCGSNGKLCPPCEVATLRARIAELEAIVEQRNAMISDLHTRLTLYEAAIEKLVGLDQFGFHENPDHTASVVINGEDFAEWLAEARTAMQSADGGEEG